MRIILTLALISLLGPSQACFAPRGGPEYDQFIELKKLDKPNTYRVTVPRQLEELGDAEITLVYTDNYAVEVPTSMPFELLEEGTPSASISATFTVQQRGHEEPRVVVTWRPKVCCTCGIHAFTQYLEVE